MRVDLAQITGRETHAREEAGMGGLELAGGVRGAGKTVAHGFGGEAGDAERLLPVLLMQYCG